MIPDKRKVVERDLKTDARQQAGEPPRYPKSGNKTDSIKHRLDDAESLVRRMASVMARLLVELPEFKDEQFLRTHWFAKWGVKEANHVLKKADALLAKREKK